MQVLSGNTASVSFAYPNTVSGQQYMGPIQWEINDGTGAVAVDPTTGASNPAVSAQIDPNNSQALLLTKVGEAIPFSVIATYPGQAGPCSTTTQSADLMWSAPIVQLSPMCATVTG